MNDPTGRRRFLQVLTAAGAGVTLGGCGGGEEPIHGDVAAGNVGDLAEGSLAAVSGHPVAIGRDAGGVYAMSLICTHEGCDMSTQGTVAATGVSCSCHGSAFTAGGAVVKGPATSPLPHYEVVIASDGAITIHGGVEVDPSTRAALPA